jgi:ribonuclease Z
LKVVFFGTAGAVQSDSDTNVCFVVYSAGYSLLVDASDSPVRNLLKAGVDPLKLDALVLTHSHTDHIYGVPSLIHNLWLMKRGKSLRIVANAHTLARAKELLELFGLPDKEGMFPMEWIDGESGVPHTTASPVLSLFPVKHSVPTSGVRIEENGAAFAYTSDTAPFDGLIESLRGCGLLIHEASGAAAREQHLNRAGHSSARQAGQTAFQTGVARLFLCHFDYAAGPLPEELRREAQGSFQGEVVVPERFKEYDIRDA